MQFILNDQTVQVNEVQGQVLADVVRTQFRMRGTTIACREGDCGACTMLVGELKCDRLQYRSLTSCIFPCAAVDGSHVVTVEGLKADKLHPIQDLIGQFGGTQCGFCTPGFVVSLIGFLLKLVPFTAEEAISAIDGNICRCTGYKSIERAIGSFISTYAPIIGSGVERSIASLVEHLLLPPYFLQIEARIRGLNPCSKTSGPKYQITGGGTDLFVQKPHALRTHTIRPIDCKRHEPPIVMDNGWVVLTQSCHIEDVKQSTTIRSAIPSIPRLLKLFASTQIRQQGTVLGNVVNASPIGDMTSLLLALESVLRIEGPQGAKRDVALQDFYKGYKQVDLKTDEIISALTFPLPTADMFVNLEKVSRRTHLDIASVNTSLKLVFDDRNRTRIARAVVSAGGVAPIPLFLCETSRFLQGKPVGIALIRNAAERMQAEVEPIDDVRGSASYKRLLLRNLFYAHFVEAGIATMEDLLGERPLGKAPGGAQ